jgi:hypothetical protein
MQTTTTANLPVVVIGAGPVGLAAAAHLLARGLEPLLLEAGPRAGDGLRRWAHVRMFSPWEFNIDKQAAALLTATGWHAPDPAGFPTGGDMIAHYLEPLAALPQIAARLRTGSRVTAVSRQRRDRMKNAQRSEVPFVVRYEDSSGEHEIVARAVIDASGTIDQPNPLGASGLPALGERAARDRIAYGMPDVLGRDRARYAGKRVLVVGSGHSAFNVLSDLARLSESEPATRILWALRRPSLQRVLGGGDNDQLRERGRLGLIIARLVQQGALQVFTGFELERIEDTADGLVAISENQTLPVVDEIVGATGFRPDLQPLAELRIALDDSTQAPVALAPLIDPNLHSCGSVRPHGAEELKHPEADVYLVGMKSYGRAPTFLLLTGYEQVRSVTAAIAGDWEAARRVELVLPETGVCITQFVDDEAPAAAASSCCGPLPASEPVVAAAKASSCCGPAKAGEPVAVAAPIAAPIVAAASCCGGPPQQDASACCVDDEVAKATTGEGCGCASQTLAPPAPVARAAAFGCR